MQNPDQEMNEALFDALDSGLIVLNADQKVAVWNSWLESATGIKKKAAIGKPLFKLLPDVNKRRLPAAISNCFSIGAASMLTHSLHPNLFPLRTRVGRPMVHDVSVKPLGAMPYKQCMVQIFDVTMAAERELVLRERQNARYAAVVDNAPDAILTIDEAGVVQFANTAAQMVFGYRIEEIVAHPAAALFQNRAVWVDAWRTIQTADATHRPIAVTGRRKDHSLTRLELSASRWSDRSGTLTTLILRDVNERQAAEAALRKLNETLEERVAETLAGRKLFADVVESTDALILVIDLQYSVLAVNKATVVSFEEIYGQRPKVGDNLLDLLAAFPAAQARVKLFWDQALAGNSLTHILSVDQPMRRHFEIKLNPLCDADGKQVAAFQYAYDITHRVESEENLARTEEALRQSQKMEAIGQLTGGIAHDFNNLLTGIIGAMDVLKRRIKAGRYEDTDRFMDAAVTSANRAAALTHRLLAFARRQPLDPRPLDPNQLLRGMEELLRRTIGEKTHIGIELQDHAWFASTDANQLENAVLNLVINANDAMPEGGRLVIATVNTMLDAPLRVGAEEVPAGDYVVISVRDTGTGMPADVVARVFDPFFTTKPIGQGTGLGLSMVYGFAKQSGGHAVIESVEGKGTSVSLYLPKSEKGAEGISSGDVQPLVGGDGETVLLVEDDSSVRLLIGEVLRDLGYRCVEATDAHAAMPMITSNVRIDLLITDVGLPRMNGRQLAEIARQHRPNIKVLFVTGYAEHATGADKFLETGMEMVTKPFALDALALKIRDMIKS